MDAAEERATATAAELSTATDEIRQLEEQLLSVQRALGVESTERSAVERVAAEREAMHTAQLATERASASKEHELRVEIEAQLSTMYQRLGSASEACQAAQAHAAAAEAERAQAAVDREAALAAASVRTDLLRLITYLGGARRGFGEARLAAGCGED